MKNIKWISIALVISLLLVNLCSVVVSAEIKEVTYSAPKFYGTQRRINDNGTIDIRFVSVTNSASGSKLGYEITASWWDVYSGTHKEKTYSADNGYAAFETNTIYTSVVASGDVIYAGDIGQKIDMQDAIGICIVSLNNVPSNIEVLFEVTTYVKNADGDIVDQSSSKNVLYENGQVSQNRVLYHNDFNDVELDVVYDAENNKTCNQAISDALGWIDEASGIQPGTTVRVTDEGKLNLTQLSTSAIRGFVILPRDTIFNATQFKIEMDVAVNTLGLVDIALGSTYDARDIASAQFRAYSDVGRTAMLGANEVHSTETNYLGMQGYKCGGQTYSDLGLSGNGWGQELHLTIEVDTVSKIISFYADEIKIFDGSYSGELDGGLCLLLCRSDITIDNLLITGDGVNSKTTVDGVPIDNYSIVYGETSMRPYAEQLAEILRIVSGYAIPVIDDNADVTNYELLVGITNRNFQDSINVGEYTISLDNNKMKFIAGDDVSSEMMMAYVNSALLESRAEGIFNIAAIVADFNNENTLRMMTFNVLNAGDDNAASRAKQLSEILLSNDLDIICLQEFDVKYRNSKYGGFFGFGGKNLNSLISERFAEVSVDGVEQQNIWNPIFYNKNKFDVEESGFVDMFIEGINCAEYDGYPGGGDGRTHFRTLVWAILKDKSTGQRYIIGNLHFSATEGDPPNGGNHAEESTFLMSKLADVHSRYSDAVMLIAGDYNSTTTYGACKNMLDSGYVNTLNIANTKGRDVNGINLGNGIDNILTSQASIKKISVYSAIALYKGDIADISDHSPIVIQFKSTYATVSENLGTQSESQIQGVDWIN